jgi:predicted dehydrogenase
MRTARFGVIGLGVWGQRHAQAYRQHPAAELAAVCDADEARLNETAGRLGVPGRFTDYRRMLESEALDAVSVVLPDFLHTEAALAAVDSGRHVLIEKPLATTRADCERIREAVRRANVKFMVDFHNRWNPGVAEMKARIDAGEIGEPLMAYYRLNDNISVPTEMLAWAGRSTVNWFLGSHCVDTLRWLFRDEVSRVYTVTRSRVLKARGIDTPDFYQSILEFTRGAVAQLETCWVLARNTPRLFDVEVEIAGEKGTFYFDGGPCALRVFTPQEAVNPDTAVCPTVHGKGVGFGIESINHFIDSVVHDREPLVGVQDGCQVTRVLLAMDESARSGRPVLVS